MVNRYTSEKNDTKILHGNDTGVSWCTIVKHHKNLYVFNFLFDEVDGEMPGPLKMNADEFEAHFRLQYGSPMDYISTEDYEWMIKD